MPVNILKTMHDLMCVINYQVESADY